MKITGETIIFKNDIGYSTSISNKKEDGTYDNMFIVVNFRKGTEIENKTKINIKDGFLSFYKTKDGLPKIKLVVMDYELIENEPKQEYDDGIIFDGDLPF